MTVAEDIMEKLGGGKGDNPVDYYKKTGKPVSLSYIVLAPPWRQFFIDKVNMPLIKIASLIAKRIPEITKENTNYRNGYAMMTVIERFMRYPIVINRMQVIRDFLKIFLYKLCIDLFYSDCFWLFTEEVIKAILRREILPRNEPLEEYFSNQTPKGEDSIIAILQNKKKLENLLGDKWILKEDA